MRAYKVLGQEYLYLSWDEMGKICFALAKKIIEAQNALPRTQRGAGYDRLVALAKGGWTWARALVDYLGVNNVASVQYEFYTQVAKTKDSPTLKQSLPISVENEKLLIFDDVVDSGETLAAAVDYLTKCGATSIASSALFFKPHSKFKPDFYAKSTSAWIIFPHEIRESVEQLSKKWKKAGMDEEKIKMHLTKIGLPEEQVEYFIK